MEPKAKRPKASKRRGIFRIENLRNCNSILSASERTTFHFATTLLDVQSCRRVRLLRREMRKIRGSFVKICKFVVLPCHYLMAYVRPVVNWKEFFLNVGGGLLR